MTTDPKPESSLLDRRDALTLGALAPLLLLACGSTLADMDDEDGDAGRAKDASDAAAKAEAGKGETSTTADAGECHEMPDETGGPYPDIDGMIDNTEYQRVDITEGKSGTPLALTLQVVDVSKSCAPVVGARVIIWHCDQNGVYSEYADAMNSDEADDDIGSTTTTYLRGWQVTDDTGRVTFKTIYPGWYSPRVTHIHVMVYNPSDLTTPVKTTQFTFPDETSAAVYAQASLYPKGQNSVTDDTDMVFGGSDEYLVAAITGSTTSGYAASLPVGLASY